VGLHVAFQSRDPVEENSIKKGKNFKSFTDFGQTFEQISHMNCLGALLNRFFGSGGFSIIS
jgi:hypothetical protein